MLSKFNIIGNTYNKTRIVNKFVGNKYDAIIQRLSFIIHLYFTQW